ncbi:hypothetical protein D3C71_1052160 [compost metagenome]
MLSVRPPWFRVCHTEDDLVQSYRVGLHQLLFWLTGLQSSGVEFGPSEPSRLYQRSLAHTGSCLEYSADRVRLPRSPLAPRVIEYCWLSPSPLPYWPT